jgi:hypothetical protein
MKQMIIHAPPEKVFSQMDDFSKTGMHMGESSMMMMGSKLKLEQLSSNATGVGSSYRWHGKVLGFTIDFRETVTEWQPPEHKKWETVGEAKIVIMSWYRMWFEIRRCEPGTLVKLFISYVPPKNWLFKCLSFLFAGLYCNWCLKNMLMDTKKAFASGKKSKRFIATP